MKEIAKTFLRLKDKGEGGLIAYVTAGDPEPSFTPRIVEAIHDGGADIIEVGIPFSDPIADGPTIQAATERALKAGTTPKKVFKVVEEIKVKNKFPIVILTYFNPVFKMGLENFFEYAEASGADGIIVADLPVEEAEEYRKVVEAHEIDTIFLAAPSTSTERLERILESTSGFLYLVSIFGVTGAREEIQDSTIKLIQRTLLKIDGKVPLAVGFGISKPEHAKIVVQNGAQAAIVGSGFVKIIEQKRNVEEEMLKELKEYAYCLKKSIRNLR